MLAAGTTSSGPGNGDRQWLNRLIGNIQKLTHELSELTRRIELLAYPAEDDVANACDLVTRLLGLIKEQMMPYQSQLREIASESGQVPNFDKELGEMYQSGQNALSAIAVYKDTLDNEHRQRQNERRSNQRYASDQKSLQKLRYEASVDVGKLLGASEGFLRFISPLFRNVLRLPRFEIHRKRVHGKASLDESGDEGIH